MKAAYVRDGAVHVGEVEEPVPSKGQALVRTHACGLCASDAHFLHSGQHVIDLSNQFGGAYAGLVVAEVELTDESERPDLPDWVGREVTGESRYSNQAMALAVPFSGRTNALQNQA